MKLSKVPYPYLSFFTPLKKRSTTRFISCPAESRGSLRSTAHEEDSYRSKRKRMMHFSDTKSVRQRTNPSVGGRHESTRSTLFTWAIALEHIKAAPRTFLATI